MNPRVVSLLSLTVVLCIPCLQISAHAQTVGQGQAQISGHVFRADTGEPVAEASVTLEPIDAPLRQRWPSEATGVDGTFRITTAPGRYLVDASALNFLGKTYSETGQQPSRPTTISLAAGQTVENIDFRLDPAGAISGTVFNDDNQPIEGVMVTAIRREYFAGGRRPTFGDGADTDEFGHFRISGLKPGTYYLRAGDDRSYSDHQFVYRPTYYPGTASIEDAEILQVAGGHEIESIRIRGVQSERAFSIHARIVDPHRSPQRRYDLTLDSASHTLQGSSSDTEFAVSGLAPGKHVLTAWAIDPAATEEGWAVKGRGYVTVQITDKDTQVDVPIGNGGEIRGRVVIDSSAVSVTGIPVWLRRSDGTGGAAAKTDESGNFAMQDVAPGRYTFLVPTLSKLAFQERVECSGIDYTTKQLEVHEGMIVTNCGIVLSTHPATIQGQVYDDSKPVSGMTVVLIPQSRELRQVERYMQVTQSGANGAFYFPVVIPGEYFLFAVPQSDGQLYFALNFADRHRSDAQSVVIQIGETQVLKVRPFAIE
jgi:hypothetical protein